MIDKCKRIVCINVKLLIDSLFCFISFDTDYKRKGRGKTKKKTFVWKPKKECFPRHEGGS